MKLERYFQIYHKNIHKILKEMNRNTHKWKKKKKKIQQSSKNKPDFAKTNEKALMVLNTASFKLVRV